MTGDGLFHIDPKGRLVSMSVTPYEAEAVLQALLETHPDLLAGGQMSPEAPRKWLLVKREQGVPDRDDSGSRWSVDHLFVDQDAVPTLVEVKRSSDTRIRREVVGQMLDYAANGIRYWPIPDLQAAFVATQSLLGNDAAEQVWNLCGDAEIGVDEFFAKVGDNLRAGRIRMVFVADVIPDELRRITEFLNEQMNPAEVFAVEVKQYRAEGYSGTVIVPAVYGRTAAASAKSGRPRSTPDRETLLAQALPATLEILGRLGGLAADLGLVVHETPAGALLKTPAGRSVANVYAGTWNTVEIPLQPLRDRGLGTEAGELLARLRGWTEKNLTDKNPQLPTPDAVARWQDLCEVVREVAGLYST